MTHGCGRSASFPGGAFSLGIICTGILCIAQAFTACADEPAVEGPPLPLKRVVLFSSSVGFFEHRGEIDGNQPIEFAFKTSDINDLLKSLVVQDRDGGFVTAVNYGSPEPLDHTLRTFAVDLTQTPSLSQIFQQLRGHRVQLEAPAVVAGVIVGIETRKIASGGQGSHDIELVNLRTQQGLESIRISDISRTKFLDPKVDADFQRALDVLAKAHANDQKRVKLDFHGEGKRRVSVGYIQESPVWKTSYRLVLDDKTAPFLQGWAIVENTTAQDWKDVQLTLISGRPISFLMNLYEPMYLSRPFVTPEHYTQLRPRTYEQDLAARAQEFEAARAKASNGRAGMFGGGAMGGMGGGMGAGMGGMGGGMGAGMGGSFGGEQRGRASKPFVTTVIPAGGDDIHLNQGVASAASGEDVGELFRYVITAPVTLNRSESAMLPIVNDTVKGDKVAIFNNSVNGKHPLTGLRLTNSTSLHLLQGPITLFDGGEYAGDARIEDIPPGSTRLISYALDLETEIVVQEKPAEQVLVSLQIRKGGLHVKHRVTREVHYVMKNSSSRAKQVLIERAIDPIWSLVTPTPAEKTRSIQRFSVTAEPGKALTFVVAEEKPVREEFALATTDTTELAAFLKVAAASPMLKKALQEAIDRKTKVAEAQARRIAAERQIAELITEQERIRRNSQGISDIGTHDPFGEPNKKLTGELLQRFLTKLGNLETELDRQRSELIELKKEEARLVRELDEHLRSLVVE